MRTRAFIVIAAAALALAGCGNHNLVLKVDVLSYLEPEQRTLHVPALPEGGLPGQQIPVVDQPVQLIDGLDEATTVRSAALSLVGNVTVAAGAGSARLRIYLGEVGSTPTTPVIDAPVTFTADSLVIVSAAADASPDVARLFTRKDLQLKVTLDDVAVTSAVSDLVVTIRRLDAVVVAGRKIE